MTHENQLVLLRKQIEASEFGIEKQRRIVQRLEASAGSATMAKEMMRTLEANLLALRADYDYLAVKSMARRDQRCSRGSQRALAGSDRGRASE
jgi:hypothetical protein